MSSKVFEKMLSKFQRRGHLNKEINPAFITLIQKVHDLVELRDSGPISLVGCAHKLLSEFLTNLMKRSFLITPVVFSGLLSIRKILDGVLIANELTDSRILAPSNRLRSLLISKFLIHIFGIIICYIWITFAKHRNEKLHV